MPKTYEPISTTTLGTTSASVTFTSIPQTYTDLVLITNAKQTAVSGANPKFRINSDSASNYSYTYLMGDGTSASSSRLSSVLYGELSLRGGSLLSTNFSNNSITHFMNYSNTTTFKTILGRSNDAGVSTELGVNLWRSTSAITTIEVLITSNAFAIGSTFTLYGIKAA
jgi:hypothetical protein